MNATIATAQPNRQALSPIEARKRKVKRARSFFIIAVLVTLVSIAGHCLPGDSPANAAGATTTQSQSGR
jgi:hypothetical protein